MRRVALSILFFFAILIGAFSQDFSTWGEIYDYEVGDIFHFEEFDETVPFYWLNKIVNIEIVEKEVSNNSDTITYKKYIEAYIESSVGNGFESYYEYRVVVNPDSLFIVDSVYYSNNYNQRKISYIGNSYGLIDIYYHYVDGCGRAKYLYRDMNSYWHWHGRTLLYFKKGDEEWGTPQFVGISETKEEIFNLLCYPNPFTTSTTLSYTLGEPSTVTISIFNPHGQLIEKIEQEQSKGEQQFILNAEGLPAGMYYFRIQAGEMIGSGKVVKIE